MGKKKNRKKDEISQIIKKEIDDALKKLVISIEFKPNINVINDTQREVAIGKQGVGAGENTNIGIVGEDGSTAAGNNPDAASVGKNGSAQAAAPESAQATTSGNAASRPNDRFNQGTESSPGNLEQDTSQ